MSVMGFRGVTLTAMLLLCACRSDLDRCYQSENWVCVKALAEEDLKKSPTCNKCRHDAAWAEKEIALADHTSPTDDLLKHLAHASAELRSASNRVPRFRPYEYDANGAEKIVEDVSNDRRHEMWQRVEDIEDHDNQVDAIIKHERYFGRRCNHPKQVQEGYDRYLNYYGSLKASSMLERLVRFEQTSLAPRLLEAYVKQRWRETPSANHMETLEQIRNLLAQSGYALLVDKQIEEAFNDEITVTKDAQSVELLCKHAYDNASGTRCRLVATTLWRSELEREPRLTQLKWICDEKLRDKEQDYCFKVLSRRVVDEFEHHPTDENERLAKSICLEGLAPCRNALQRILYQRQAEITFHKFESEGAENAPIAAKDSVDLWTAYIEMFNDIAVQMFGRGATMQRLAPQWFEQANRKAEDIRQGVKNQLRDLRLRCDFGLPDESQPLARLQRMEPCVDSLEKLAQQDQTNLNVRSSLQSLYNLRAELIKERAPTVSYERPVFAIVLTELVRYAIPVRGNLILNVLRSLLLHR